MSKLEKDISFDKATRRLLFRKSEHPSPEQSIPGAGRSAARIPERHSRVKVTMNVDGDIIAYFKARAKEDGRPYQTLMNQILREHVSGNRVERLADQVAVELLGDEDFLSALSEKVKSGK